MSRKNVLTVAALTAIACSPAKAPEVAPDPARGLRTFTETDPVLSEIAVEAARSLPLEGRTMPAFAGVYVNGRKFRDASDAVVRATGFTAVSSAGPTRVECGVQNMSTGATTKAPCPASVVMSLPPVYSFAEVRATADSAYVGTTRHSQSAAALVTCMTLARAGGRWMVRNTVPIGDPKRCGK